MSAARPGEQALPFDPRQTAGDASIVFIGRIESPWIERANCPKNTAAARQTGRGASIRLDAAWRDGLLGLERASHIIVLTWLDRSRRDLIVQKPRHAEHPSGVFALRTPVRPNPIGLHVCALVGIDAGAGLISIDAMDALDGTPVIDLKPYFASTDAFPEATRVDRADR